MVGMQLALRNGHEVDIEDAQGVIAEYYCPCCVGLVTPTFYSQLNAWFFRHEGKVCENSLETNLKSLAKNLIAARATIIMPRLTAVLPEVIATEPGYNPVVIPHKKITKTDWLAHFSRVDLDVEYAEIVVDALADQNGHKCAISINVGDEFDNTLIPICEKASISMLEIKLDPFIALGMPLADLEQYVLFNAPRRWLHNNKFNRWCIDAELKRQVEAKKLVKFHSKPYVAKGNIFPIKRSKRFGLISEVMISQSTMLTLSSVNQCRECKLISLTSNQCTHCSSKSIEKVKSSRLSKATLEQSVRNRYTEVMA